MTAPNIALLTAGGLAPCLSATIGSLIQQYTAQYPQANIICYRNGYMGVLQGDSVHVSPGIREQSHLLSQHGGSVIGNSRVKLTNADDCQQRGLIPPDADPLAIACQQLISDKIDILHPIGGDDTNTTAIDLARYVAQQGHTVTVVGLPKTVDNDIVPIAQSLGAYTAAEQGAIFFENVVNEASAHPRMLLIHEVMGRHCGWLTAATAASYQQRLAQQTWLPELGLTHQRHAIHAVYLPEHHIDLDSEAIRLKDTMDEYDCCNIFISEGAGVDSIVAAMEQRGEDVPRDAFGHVRLDSINPGQYFAKTIAPQIGAQRVLVQKSGYFARSAAPNQRDSELIAQCVSTAIQGAMNGQNGVVGADEDRDHQLRVIEPERIKGGKRFESDMIDGHLFWPEGQQHP